MDIAVLILASASLPIIAYNLYFLFREREVDIYYGVVSGLYTFAAAIAVSLGFPGNLIMPVSFSIIGFGSLHAFIESRRRGKAAKALIFLALGAALYLMGVIL